MALKTNFNLKDTLTNTKDTFGTYYKDFNIKDHYNKMDKTIFANPFKNVGSLVEDVKGFKNLAGSGFSVGAKAAGRLL